MNRPELPWNGACRCGQVRLRVTKPPVLAAACHCGGCQRMASSAFSLTLMVPADGFAVTAGEPVVGGLHGATQHLFCPHCLTWMFTRPEGFDWVVNLRPSMLDEHGWFSPFVEVWVKEKLPWAATGAPHCYETEPAAEEYEGLLAKYAAFAAGG